MGAKFVNAPWLVTEIDVAPGAASYAWHCAARPELDGSACDADVRVTVKNANGRGSRHVRLHVTLDHHDDGDGIQIHATEVVRHHGHEALKAITVELVVVGDLVVPVVRSPIAIHALIDCRFSSN